MLTISHTRIWAKLPWSRTRAMQRSCSTLQSCTRIWPTVLLAAFRITQSPGCRHVHKGVKRVRVEESERTSSRHWHDCHRAWAIGPITLQMDHDCLACCLLAYHAPVRQGHAWDGCCYGHLCIEWTPLLYGILRHGLRLLAVTA